MFRLWFSQDLTWESASAIVRSVAIFSDGTSMDVTDTARLGLMAVGGARAPAVLDLDAYNSPRLTTNASVSTKQR